MNYALYLLQKEVISDFLNEFCKNESYVGEIFDITPKKLLNKFVNYCKERKGYGMIEIIKGNRK